MKTDYESCEECGAVTDIEVLKKLEDKRSKEEQDIEDYKYYADFYDFEKWVCPNCKCKNQR